MLFALCIPRKVISTPSHTFIDTEDLRTIGGGGDRD